MTNNPESIGKTPYDWMDHARQAAAQCWCDEETSDRVMDPVLAEAVARRIAAWMQTGAQHATNESYWRDRARTAETELSALTERIKQLEGSLLQQQSKTHDAELAMSQANAGFKFATERIAGLERERLQERQQWNTVMESSSEGHRALEAELRLALSRANAALEEAKSYIGHQGTLWQAHGKAEKRELYLRRADACYDLERKLSTQQEKP